MVHLHESALFDKPAQTGTLVVLPRIGSVPSSAVRGDQPLLRFAQTDADAITQYHHSPARVLICEHPTTSWCAEHIRTLPGGHAVTILVVASTDRPQQETAAFAARIRAAATFPPATPLPELLQAARSLTQASARPTPRRLVTLARLWQSRQTGVLRAQGRDGTRTWLSLRDGEMLEGCEPALQQVLCADRIRFDPVPVSGTTVDGLFGQQLLAQAYALDATEFLHQWSDHRPLAHPERLSSLPLSPATRRVLATANGQRTLQNILVTNHANTPAVCAELCALHRLELLSMDGDQPPRAAGFSAQHCSRARRRLQRDLSRMRQRPGRSLGLPEDAPPKLVRKVARRMLDRYGSLASDPRWPEDIRSQAAQMQALFQKHFLSGRLSL